MPPHQASACHGLAGVFDEPGGPDDEFTFGLERILDGIEVLLSAHG